MLEYRAEFRGMLFKAETVRKVCAISARKLDYWISTSVISPSKTYRARNGVRDLFLFSFEDLVRIRLVNSLRALGVTLKEVRAAIECLTSRGATAWQAEWLVTDGNRVFRRTGDDELETISSRGRGQLVFSIIALGSAQRHVYKELKRSIGDAFDDSRYGGQVRPYRATR